MGAFRNGFGEKNINSGKLLVMKLNLQTWNTWETEHVHGEEADVLTSGTLGGSLVLDMATLLLYPLMHKLIGF